MLSKIQITGKIEVITGMHIGGSSAFAAIGAVDSPIIRDVSTNLPMIPGSSLKGKMRTLLAKKYNDTLASNPNDDNYRITRLFGSSKKGNIKVSRLLFSDMVLGNAEEIRNHGAATITEVKFENTINRATAVANPRQIERVIRGSEFDLDIIYEVNDDTVCEIVEDMEVLANGFKLLEYDYIGGSGSRGYGKIKFNELQADVVIGDIDNDIMDKCNQMLENIWLNMGGAMFYGIYKFKFPYGVHFGDKKIDSSVKSFCADTLFSALCIELLKNGEDFLEKLLLYVNEGKLLLSDAFPFVNEELLLPKPFIKIGNDDGNSLNKKKFKKIKYVSASCWNDFFEGQLDPDIEEKIEKKIGTDMMKISANTREFDETLPYSVKCFRFYEKSGLYIIYGYENDEVKNFLGELLESLSFSGIGGKRSAGYGRYEMYHGKLPKLLEDNLNKESDKYVSLSISLPSDDELEEVVSGASFNIIKRSGFVESLNYADTFMKKRDLYMFSSGSVFEKRFVGKIFDVSSQGNHPVYRYGKPIFLGV